jgi:hypothetical protein
MATLPLVTASLILGLQARLSRRRHVVTSACEQHIATAFAAVDSRLTVAAKVERYRWRKVLQMRETRRKAKEAAAD